MGRGGRLAIDIWWYRDVRGTDNLSYVDAQPRPWTGPLNGKDVEKARGPWTALSNAWVYRAGNAR
jgi:hypothetical protein